MRILGNPWKFQLFLSQHPTDFVAKVFGRALVLRKSCWADWLLEESFWKIDFDNVEEEYSEEPNFEGRSKLWNSFV